LVADVLPQLPPGPIWEPAAGDGRLAEAMRAAGRSVLGSDVLTRDFLTAAPPIDIAAIVTNPPFNRIDAFIKRALAHLEGDVTDAVVLLMRWDHLTARRRTGPLEGAAEIRVCPWRPRWIEGSTISPRWSFAWVTWRRDHHGPPVYAWSRKPASP
jgi:hypothetical protein